MKDYTFTVAQPGWVAYFLDWDIDPNWEGGEDDIGTVGDGLIPSPKPRKMDIAGWVAKEEDDNPRLYPHEAPNVTAMVRYGGGGGELIAADDWNQCGDFLCIRGPNEAPPDLDEIEEAHRHYKEREEAAEARRLKAAQEAS